MAQNALYEHRFWLQIMGDHARFIYNTLSSIERDDIQTAGSYIQAYDGFLEKARRATSVTETMPISQQSYEMTIGFRKFKLDLLRRAILGKVSIGLTPTFLNHMVSEKH